MLLLQIDRINDTPNNLVNMYMAFCNWKILLGTVFILFAMLINIYVHLFIYSYLQDFVIFLCFKCFLHISFIVLSISSLEKNCRYKFFT